MAKYSLDGVTFILENYWVLRSGQLTFDKSMSGSDLPKSPYETAMVMVADIDTAIDGLDSKHPRRWLDVVIDITPARLCKIAHQFNYFQQAIIRYYLLLDAQREVEKEAADIAVKIMCRLLNKKITSET